MNDDTIATIKYHILNGYVKRYPHADAGYFVDDIFNELFFTKGGREHIKMFLDEPTIADEGTPDDCPLPTSRADSDDEDGWVVEDPYCPLGED